MSDKVLDKKLNDDKKNETTEEYPEVSVNDYTLLPGSYEINSVYAIGKRYKKVIAIGNIEVGEESYISTLVLTDEGILVPSFTLDGFEKVIERKTNWDNNEPGNRRKSIFGMFRKSKSKPKRVTDEEINKMIERLNDR